MNPLVKNLVFQFAAGIAQWFTPELADSAERWAGVAITVAQAYIAIRLQLRLLEQRAGKIPHPEPSTHPPRPLIEPRSESRRSQKRRNRQ